MLTIWKHPHFCFNTQPPEGDWGATRKTFCKCGVSTHSRPKATVQTAITAYRELRSFNTQPPEGDCLLPLRPCRFQIRFNTQPPEGDCFFKKREPKQEPVSTHSRPKATDVFFRYAIIIGKFQHTAARRRLGG